MHVRQRSKCVPRLLENGVVETLIERKAFTHKRGR